MLKTRLKAAVVKGFENELIVRPKNSEYEGKNLRLCSQQAEAKIMLDVFRLSFDHSCLFDLFSISLGVNRP